MSFPLSGKIYAIEAKDSTDTVLHATTDNVERFIQLQDIFCRWRNEKPGRRVSLVSFPSHQLTTYQNLIREFRVTGC